MVTSNVTLCMDEELKSKQKKLFSALDLSMTTALTTFVKQAVREQ